MSTEIERLIYTDLNANNNKFWDAELNGTTVVTRWGRVGDTGQSKAFPFGDPTSAQMFFERKVREKMRKGYTKQHTMAADGGAATIQVARKVQIEHAGDAETSQLIDFLVKRNVHKIEGMTSVRLEAGKLTTPLGPVTAAGLDEAQKILIAMSKRGAKAKLGDLANAYLRIVPRDFGRRRIEPASLFGTKEQLEQEQATIDSLRAVVEDLADKAKTASTETGPVFETKLELASKQDFDRVNKLFAKTLNSRHQSARLKLRRMWSMSIKAQEDAFESNLTPVWELWHGTKDVNLLSILKNGFIIPRSGQGIAIAGRMYGDGVYFSDQSTKSLNYAGGYWGGAASQRPFMLLNDVAMGKIFNATRPFSGGCPRGHDSAFAKAGTAVMNNEMIVYRLSQIRAKFLCEFGN